MDKRQDPKWLEQNTYIEKRSKKRTLNKAGRVDLAHDEKLDHVLPVVIQVPSDENGHYAVVQTTVQTSRGSFTDVGTANPGDAGGKPVLQMAAARALNRALDLALNYGRQADSDVIVALDEDDTEPVEMMAPEYEEKIARIMAADPKTNTRSYVEEVLRRKLGLKKDQSLTDAPATGIAELLNTWLENLGVAA